MPEDIIRTLDQVATAAGLSTQHNKRLPQPAPTPAIPARVGTAASNAQAS